jgi:hypothetical protein
MRFAGFSLLRQWPDFANVTAIIGVVVGPWPQKGDNKGAFFKSTHWKNIRFSSSMER